MPEGPNFQLSRPLGNQITEITICNSTQLPKDLCRAVFKTLVQCNLWEFVSFSPKVSPQIEKVSLVSLIKYAEYAVEVLSLCFSKKKIK